MKKSNKVLIVYRIYQIVFLLGCFICLVYLGFKDTPKTATKQEVIKINLDNLYTSAELKEFEKRKSNIELYKSFLEENKVFITDEPYDFIEQMVYNILPNKDETYTVRVYKVNKEINNPTYKDVLSLYPELECKSVNSNSDLPNNLKEELSFGYKLITYNNNYCILEVLYDKIDLSEWRKQYKSVKLVETSFKGE